MPHRLAVALATTVLSVAGFSSAASAAPAEPPIIAVGPQQYFVGQVNGLSSGATIKVICAGPAATGYPADGQTIGVALVTPPFPGPISALGYTGDAATSITATQTASASAAPIATFTWYANQTLSTKLQLPCSGTGTITFAPAPDKGGRAAMVTVQFVSNTVVPKG